MSKLTVMKYNRMMMVILGINPYSFPSTSLNWLRLMSPFLIIITMSICVVLQGLYTYQQTHLPLILEGVVLVIGGSTALSAYVNMKWKVDSVAELNLKFQKIVDQGAPHKQHELFNQNLLSRCTNFSFWWKDRYVYLLDCRTKMSPCH